MNTFLYNQKNLDLFATYYVVLNRIMVMGVHLRLT